jgi:hypothetical protein
MGSFRKFGRNVLKLDVYAYRWPARFDKLQLVLLLYTKAIYWAHPATSPVSADSHVSRTL